MRPVAGCEFRNGNELLYVALAKDNQGYAELNVFLTQHNVSKLPYPEQAPQWEHVFVIYPFGKRNPNLLRENEFLGVRLSQLAKLFRCDYLDKLVMMQPLTFADEDDFQLHQNLRAIDKNILISRLEKEDCATEDEIFLSLERLKTSYVLYPQLIENTANLLDHCEINLNGEIKTGNVSPIMCSMTANCCGNLPLMACSTVMENPIRQLIGALKKSWKSSSG